MTSWTSRLAALSAVALMGVSVAPASAQPGKEKREERREVAAPGPDLEHLVVAPRGQERQEVGLQRRLGRRLSVPDRDRRVLVRAGPYSFGNEEMSGHPVEELENLQIVDPVLPDLFDQLPPVPDETHVV